MVLSDEDENEEVEHEEGGAGKRQLLVENGG
jgi:hypothetical protein